METGERIKNTCPNCGDGKLYVIKSLEKINYKGNTLIVKDVRAKVCDTCDFIKHPQTTLKYLKSLEKDFKKKIDKEENVYTYLKSCLSDAKRDKKEKISIKVSDLEKLLSQYGD